MSDDLISRKALMEGRVENDPVRIAAMCAETAFDKEKVIEELRYISSLGKIPDQDSAGYGEGYLDERVIPLRGAIKIVKEGSIDG